MGQGSKFDSALSTKGRKCNFITRSDIDYKFSNSIERMRIEDITNMCSYLFSSTIM